MIAVAIAIPATAPLVRLLELYFTEPPALVELLLGVELWLVTSPLTVWPLETWFDKMVDHGTTVVDDPLDAEIVTVAFPLSVAL